MDITSAVNHQIGKEILNIPLCPISLTYQVHIYIYSPHEEKKNTTSKTKPKKYHLNCSNNTILMSLTKPKLTDEFQIDCIKKMALRKVKGTSKYL